jgi:preprotein translocase subunit YajC
MLNNVLEVLCNIVWNIVAAQAQQADVPMPSFFEILSKMAPMFLVVYLIFYFMVLKPQQQKLKKQQSLLDSLKKGEMVVTSGGLIGKVSGFEEDCVILELSNNLRLKVEREHVVKRRQSKQTQTEKAA